MTVDLSIKFVAVPAFIESLEREWASARAEVEKAAGDGFARTVDGIVRATGELFERPTNPDGARDRLWHFASELFTSSKILGSPELSHDHAERDAAAQIITRLGVWLLNLRAVISDGRKP